MKNYRLSQLAGHLLEGPGTIPGEEKYAKKIILSTEDPPMVEVTLGIDKTFVEGGGFKPMSNKRVNPDSVMGIRNVITGGTVVYPPIPLPVGMSKWGAHLAGEAAATLQPEAQVTPTKDAGQAGLLALHSLRVHLMRFRPWRLWLMLCSVQRVQSKQGNQGPRGGRCQQQGTHLEGGRLHQWRVSPVECWTSCC